MTGLAALSRPSPVIAAPMAGVSCPELAAAVSEAGGLGFLAAGNLTAAQTAAMVTEYQRLTDAPVAVNLFTPQIDRSTELAAWLGTYRDELVATAQRYDVEPGAATYDEDDFAAKVDWLVHHRVDAVTFTFGPAPIEAVAALRSVRTEIGFTVTCAHEAREAAGMGATFLVAQGVEAGGHRGTWHLSDEPNALTAVQVTRQAQEVTDLPVIATGGVDDAAAVRDRLAAGAFAVAVGTRFVAAEESRAAPAHVAALTSGAFPEAAVTRAFSGRYARSLVNDFVRTHDKAAPAAYPQVHHLVKPIRSAAAVREDPQGIALWAGTGHAAAYPAPAAEITARLTP